MKFISKSSNLLIVLRPGLSAQPLTGTPARPTISVRFKEGVADVQQEEIVTMMLAHPGFNSDFISADNIQVDPYASTRQPSEPTHVVTEMKFGTPVNRTIGGKPQVPPEMAKLVQSLAVEMAKQMLPSMVEATLKELVKSHEEEKKAPVAKARKKPGRKPKQKPVESTVEIPPAVAENPAVKESVV